LSDSGVNPDRLVLQASSHVFACDILYDVLFLAESIVIKG